jgi:hypothetical protein
MIIHLIISRFNENLNWIDYIPKNLNIKIIIYNKGLNDIKYKNIKLPNIGRESHTYLYHIIKNYNNLADINIFTQGDPFFHNPNFIYDLYKINTFELTQPLSYGYNYIMPPSEIKQTFFEKHNTNFYIDYVDDNFQPNYMYYYNHTLKSLIDNIKKKLNIENVLEYYIKKFNILNIKSKYLLPVSYAALFSINKKIIKKRNIHFYENILKILIETTEFDLGHIIERLWLSIFYYNISNTNYLPLLKENYKLEDFIFNIKNNNISLQIPIIHNQFFTLVTKDNKNYEENILLNILHNSCIIKIFNNKKKEIFYTFDINNKFNINININNNNIVFNINNIVLFNEIVLKNIKLDRLILHKQNNKIKKNKMLMH